MECRSTQGTIKVGVDFLQNILVLFQNSGDLEPNHTGDNCQSHMEKYVLEPTKIDYWCFTQYLYATRFRDVHKMYIFMYCYFGVLVLSLIHI